MKERNKDQNNIKEIIVRLKSIFHDLKIQLIIKDSYSNIGAFQNCYHKHVFIFTYLNAVKNKADINKSLIMHNLYTLLGFYYYKNTVLTLSKLKQKFIFELTIRFINIRFILRSIITFTIRFL